MNLNGYSLWFVPSGEVYNKLKNLIHDLSRKHNTSSFEPHVSLYGLLNTKLTEKEIISGSADLAKRIKPFKIRLSGVQHLDEYFRCLFVKAQTDEIFDAYKKADDIFKCDQGRDFLPHLSLMYGNLSVKIKEKIAKDMGNLKMEFLADRIYLYRIKGKPDEWKRIREFQI